MSGDISIEKAKSIAMELCSLPVTEVTFSGSGANSRIFKIKTTDKYYALKFFRQNADGINSRLNAEVAASNFFKRFDFANTTEIVQHSNQYNCALFNWIEGSKVEKITRVEIDAALTFVKKLFQIEHGPELISMPYGIEACISGIEVVNQINKRLVNLDRSAAQHPPLAELLSKRFKPLFNEIISTATEVYSLCGQSFNEKLADKLMILSPVDFGFHNALLSNKEIVFFDFEYFGWDDPTHLVADTILHPGMNISDEDKKHFKEVALELLKARDPFIEARYAALIPLYALRWACIILNPFLDTYQVINANVNSADDLANLRSRQFSKAELYLQKAEVLLEQLKMFCVGLNKQKKQ